MFAKKFTEEIHLNYQTGETLNMADQAEFDYFCTQFRDSLIKEADAPEGDPNDWFGRLLRFRNGQPYRMVNFFGKNYTEREFRDKLQKDEIKVKAFDFTSPIKYTIDSDNPMFAVAVVSVHIEAVVDGKNQSGDFNFTHKIKRAWQAYETSIE